MKRITLRTLAASVACIASTGALAYDSPTVWNVAQVPAAVVVHYAACKSDSFTVPAKNVQGPGKATASANRGACLITSVTATLQGKPYAVAAYSSKGSPHHNFLIWYAGGNPPYKITVDKDMSADNWGVQLYKDESPDGPLGSTANSRAGDLNVCQTANQASIRQLEARIAGAPAGKLTKAQKDHYASIRESLKPIPGQKGTLENCHKKTATIAGWKAEVDKALGTTM